MLDTVREKKTLMTRKRKIQNEKYKKNQTTTVRFFTFTFCLWKSIYFVHKGSLGTHTITFAV